MINLVELIEKRVLLKIGIGYHPTIQEYKIIEVSPSENWIKLMNHNGLKFWKPINDVSLVEVLKDLKTGKPKE